MFLLLLAFHFEQARAQHAQRFGAVLDLRFLVLAGNHDAGRQVRDAHGGIRGVDGLAARAGRAERVNADFLRFNMDFNLVGFREHGDGDRRGMDAALLFGGRDALHAVDAAFEPQAAVNLPAFDERDDFLEPADGRQTRR